MKIHTFEHKGSECHGETSAPNCGCCNSCVFRGPAGPSGKDGASATIRVGNVTTGSPGSQASVTNSGTEQHAVLDFTIPRGDTGTCCCHPLELLSAYSTSPQPAAGESPLILDVNALKYGDAISHVQRTADFVIHEPGVYSVSFFGTAAPALCVHFPLTITLSLQRNGYNLPGGTVLHVFHTPAENVPISFTLPVEIGSAPASLRILSTGGNVFYSGINMSVCRLGDIPATFL